MTTQYLRTYIDRVLGNSLRCLLPSYWWKRLFGVVADTMDSKQDKIKDLDSIREGAALGKTALQPTSGGYATTDQVNELRSEIEETEQVIAASLVDLNKKLAELSAKIEELSTRINGI